MARTNATNFSGALQFPYASAATDLFKKEDVQTLALAVDQHDHSAGKGLSVIGAIADGSITNAKLGPDVARANLLTNGGFEIWQRGNGPFTGSGNYAADRWVITLTGGDTLSVSKNTANQDTGSTACAAVTCTRSAGTQTQLVQSLNPSDYASQPGRIFTFSIRVRTSTANAVQAAVYNGTAWATGAFHTGGGAYESLSLTFTAGTGTCFVALFFQASCTAYVDNAMLVVGSQPANYVPLHPADDLARCLRYYEKSADTYLCNGAGLANAGEFVYPHLARKAVTPTLTLNAVGQTVRMGGGGIAVTGYPFTSPGLDKSMFQATVASGIAGGQAVTLAGGSIAVEANP